jgi:putative ABC transport system ATP-binding protein
MTSSLTVPPSLSVRAAVRAEQLVKTYGRGDTLVTALRGVDVSFAACEFSAIMGPSGSGKSTLMHVLAGLDTATSGTAWIGDTALAPLSDKALTALRRDQVGFVFQAFHLLPELSGLENVLLPARLSRDAEALERGKALVASLGLADVAERLPSLLSGGEQQRLAVARALVNDPLVGLADEPTGNLDPDAGASVLALLRHVAGRGKAVLLVTHEPSAVEVADRVLRLESGRLSA